MKPVSSMNGHPGGRGWISYLRRSELPGIEVLSYAAMARPMSCFTSGSSISHVIESRSTIRVGRIRKSVANQDIFVWAPETIFGHLRVPRPETLKVIFIPPPSVRQILEELELEGHELETGINPINDRSLLEMLRTFHQRFEARTATRLEVESRLLRLLRYVIERRPDPEASPRRIPIGMPSWPVQQVLSLIDARCAEKITLQDLADVTGMSRYQVLRMFSREVGIPPHTYQLHRRIQRARALLTAGLAPAHVAADLGFYDQSHFIRCFKRQVGLTPLEYSGS